MLTYYLHSYCSEPQVSTIMEKKHFIMSTLLMLANGVIHLSKCTQYIENIVNIKIVACI